MHKELRVQIDSQFARIADTVTALHAGPPSKGMYATTRHLRLRERPDSSAKTIIIIEPNNVVDELEREGNWLQIEFADHANEKVYQGWVFKRFLRALDAR